MSTWVVQVEFDDYDQGRRDRMYGPFTSRDTAEKFIARLKLPEVDREAEGYVGVYARPVFPAKIRPIRRDAKQFIQDLTEE